MSNEHFKIFFTTYYALVTFSFFNLFNNLHDHVGSNVLKIVHAWI